MKNKFTILIFFALLGCNPASNKYSNGETVTVLGLQQSCNCVITLASREGPYVHLICEDLQGKFSEIELNMELIATCDEK